ncbi:hypothetical protein BH23VER1_BH23VER1_32240 [soil metagenome]
MNRRTPSTSGTRAPAFILMEVLLAVALFGMAGLGLSMAINRTAKNANQTRIEYQMISRLQSALTEASKAARMEEDKIVTEPDELGIFLTTEIIPMEEIENAEGQFLQNMWLIRCTAIWERSEEILEMEAETYRYLPLYQPQ